MLFVPPVKHMLHPHTELRHVSDEIGYGVFATRRIPKGTITWVRDDLDQSFDPDDIRRFSPEYQSILEKYSFVDAAGQAVLCWDLARYLNHSCRANCLGAGYDFEIAIRDIEVNEELTDDYGTLNLRSPFPCSCGIATCRKVVQPDDLMRFWESWDRDLREAFRQIFSVDQPLRAFVKDFARLEEPVTDPAKMRSCRFNYHPQVYHHQRQAS
jgi:uncharacterized protein